MKKSVFALAVIAAVCSGLAFAAEVKKDKAHLPAVKAATTMSDADMDKVTAGYSTDNNGLNGAGIGASGLGKGQGAGRNNGHGRF